MTAPRGLTAEEAAAWEKLASTVTPMHRAPTASRPKAQPQPIVRKTAPASVPATPDFSELLASGAGSRAASKPRPTPLPAKPEGGLDGHWDRRFKSGLVEPDFTLDLHGHTLDSAHARLDHEIAQAKAMGARVILLIAGKPRPVDAADRASKRGAIRAKILDWLAAGPHGADIAAIRNAHRRHGGAGALYLVLRRNPSSRT